MTGERTYPHGVTCWVDTSQPDPVAASRFYAELFGWTVTEVVPAGMPGSYLVATLDGHEVAGLAPSSAAAATWNTFVAVDDVDAAVAAVTAAGGTVVSPPQDAGPAGRVATCRDPLRTEFRLWQPGHRLGAQLVNSPGSWNFSDLHTTDAAAAIAFYTAVFGWVAAGPGEGAGTMLRVPGYGDHLAATVDPGIRERQASAPPGFADVIGGLVVVPDGERPSWRVTFTVADRDDAVARAERLGAAVLATWQDAWTASARIRDPQGAELTLSQFTPPAGTQGTTTPRATVAT
jgi:predicted enzyme related to lactoylglutathione lyase